MRRRHLLRSAAIATTGLFAGCSAPGSGSGAASPSPSPLPSPSPSPFEEGFENGVGDWETDAAIGPEVDVADFEWTIGVTDEKAAAGEHSLAITNEGTYDDGTSWAVHPIEIDADRADVARVRAAFWSESESFNTIRDAVMYLGPDPPATEEDFPGPGQNTSVLGETPYGGLREPLWLEAGWREYAFEWTTPRLSTDTLHLAVGTSVIWEAEATHYVDEIRVAFETR